LPLRQSRCFNPPEQQDDAESAGNYDLHMDWITKKANWMKQGWPTLIISMIFWVPQRIPCIWQLLNSRFSDCRNENVRSCRFWLPEE
jgi:hypothetical protein